MLTRSLVVGVCRSALDPDVAALEVFPFPHRRDLLDAFDHVPARRVGVAAMRRSRYNRDARFPDVHSPRSVMQGDAYAWPSFASLSGNAGERLERERSVRL